MKKAIKEGVLSLIVILIFCIILLIVLICSNKKEIAAIETTAGGVTQTAELKSIETEVEPSGIATTEQKETSQQPHSNLSTTAEKTTSEVKITKQMTTTEKPTTEKFLLKLPTFPQKTTAEPKYSPQEFKRAGVIYYNGYKFTYYSEKVLPGPGLKIPGRHSDGNFVRDENNYICVASSDLPKGTVVDTPFGKGKVYDTGCPSGVIDIYVGW